MQFFNNTVAVREISHTAALMKLLLVIEVHVTTAAFLCRLADEGPGGSRRFLSKAMALEWPWSYPGQSTVEFWGGALKTSRVTGALVQCPKLCQYISQIAENESQALSGSDLFSAIRGRKTFRQCTVSTIVGKFRVHGGNGSEDGN